MPRPLKRGILGASTIILSKDIDKYAFMCGSNFYETDVDKKMSVLSIEIEIISEGAFYLQEIFNEHSKSKIDEIS